MGAGPVGYLQSVERLNRRPPNTNPSCGRNEDLISGSQDLGITNSTPQPPGIATSTKSILEIYFWKKKPLPFLLKQERNRELVHHLRRALILIQEKLPGTILNVICLFAYRRHRNHIYQE